MPHRRRVRLLQPAATAYAETPPFQPAKPESLLNRTIPVSSELPRYRAPSARRDVVAGVTVAALAVPAAMAYAEVAGVSPVNGLYALLLPAVAYVLLGSSRQLIVGPEGSISTLVGAAVLPLAAAGQRQRGRTGRDARTARRGVLRPCLAAAPGLDRRLLLPSRAAGLHPRRRGRPDHRPAWETRRSLDRCARPAPAALGSSARAQQHQRDDGRGCLRQRSRRCSRSAC